MEEVLDLLRQNARLSVEDISAMTKKTVDEVKAIIKKLEDAGVAVKYVFLDGEYKAIHDRILARGETEDCWCMRNIEMCLDAQHKDCHAVHIDATSHSPDEIVQLILH